MDVVSHAASGAVAVLACSRRPRTAWAVPLAALAAAAPDADIFFASLPLDFLLLHRGISHAFAAVPLMGFVLALLMYPYWRKGVAGAWGFGTTWLFAMLLTTLHIYLDCVTTYGTMVFLPFSDYRVRLNGIFIVDIFLLLPMLVGLWYGLRRQSAAVAACIWMLLYPAACVGLRLYHEHNSRHQLAATGQYATHMLVLPDAFAPLFWRRIYQTDTPFIPQKSPTAPTIDKGADQEFAFAAAKHTVWHQGLDYRGRANTEATAHPAADTALIASLSRVSSEARAFFAFTVLPIQDQRPYAHDAHATEYRFYDARFGSTLPFVRWLLSQRQSEAILFQMQARRHTSVDAPWDAVRLAFVGANRTEQWHTPLAIAPPTLWQWALGYHTFASDR